MTDIVGVFKNRRIAICRELTKIHESLVVKPINEVSEFIANNKLQGEITLVIEGQSTQNTEQAQLKDSILLAEFGHLTESGLSRRAAIRTLATRYRCSTRDIYQRIETNKRQGFC